MPRVGNTEFAYTQDGAAKAQAYGSATGQSVDYGGANTNKDVGLAAQGRFGDSEMRDVGGELSHVNSVEAQWIDRYGKSGEDLVQKLGTGTINPETGEREYPWWVIPAIVATIVAAVGTGPAREYAATGTTTWKGSWDYGWGNKGLHDYMTGTEYNPSVQESEKYAAGVKAYNVEESIERRGQDQVAPGGLIDQEFMGAAAKVAGSSEVYDAAVKSDVRAQEDYEMAGMEYGTGEFNEDGTEIMASGDLGLASEAWDADQETATEDTESAWDKYLQTQATRTAEQYRTGEGTVNQSYKMNRDYEAALRQTGMSESGALRKMVEGDKGLLESDYAAAMVESKRQNESAQGARDDVLRGIENTLHTNSLAWDDANTDYVQAGQDREAASDALELAETNLNVDQSSMISADAGRQKDVDAAIGVFDSEWSTAQSTYQSAIEDHSKQHTMEADWDTAAGPTGEKRVPQWITDHLRPEGSAPTYEGWGFNDAGEFVDLGQGV